MKILTKLLSLLLLIYINVGCNKLFFIDDKDFLIVTNYIKPNTGEDVSKQLQRLIDNNPNRTFYFPDGEYCISSPIRTSANPNKTVSLKLSNYATLKAIGNWSHGAAMIALGGAEYSNDIFTPGSNYFFEGGIVDGSGEAKGISVDSGRETVIKNVSLKNVRVGIHILKGANNGSSDCDISDVNIVGTGEIESVGVLVDGNDNTFSNMRIANVYTGVLVRSSCNHFREIHPLYYGNKNLDEHYNHSCGFIDEVGDNCYQFCYSDEFAIGFFINGTRSIYDNCLAYWYSQRGDKHVAFKSNGVFNSTLTNFTVCFEHFNYVKNNVVLEADKDGKGVIHNLYVKNEHYLTDFLHLKYIK